MRKFVFRTLLVVLALALVASGCSPAPTPAATPPGGSREAPGSVKPDGWKQKWEQVVGSARREGDVLVYGELGADFRERLRQDFGNKYGINVQFVVGRAAEVGTRYVNERAANIHLADVLIVGMATTLGLVKPRGGLAPIKPHLILPEVLDPQAWHRGMLPFLDKDEMALWLVSGFSSYMVTNTDLVKGGEVSSYQDLLSPRWKGKIILNDPTVPGSGSMWTAFVLLRVMGKEKGEAYLRQLATQDLTITRDLRLQGESVARGKYAVAIAPSSEVTNALAEAGAPLRWQSLKEGGLVNSGLFVAGLPPNPPHPNAATLMLNHLLSREGQLAVSQTTGEPPMRTDIPLSGLKLMLGRVPEAGENIMWIDEEQIVSAPRFYPLSREIFGIR